MRTIVDWFDQICGDRNPMPDGETRTTESTTNASVNTTPTSNDRAMPPQNIGVQCDVDLGSSGLDYGSSNVAVGADPP